MTTALYARVSTAHQAQEQTIASQVAVLPRHASERGDVSDDAHRSLADGYRGAP